MNLTNTTIIAAGLTLLTGAASAQTPVLTVYTYDSFNSEWGPGPGVEFAFEELCACDLQFTSTGDGAALLARLRLEGARSDADIVLGLDTNLMTAAVEAGLMAEHGVTPEGLTLPIAWNNPHFLPFDWGYFAFVHRADMDDVPGSFEELAASDASIVIQDPRSSTPGLGLLMWVQNAYGDEAAAIWEGLADNIVTVTPGWSEAYGLFLEGEADMVLSYTTSPAYHLIAEEDDSYDAALFSEGHYMQIEVGGILQTADTPALAQQFMEFMVSPAFQNVIPETNWMYPAALPAEDLPEGFETLMQPSAALIFTPEDAASARDEALAIWQNALSQ
ncbi:thiamine ABC transporter substrate binding subunit [Rhodobacteraceae bacterium N5(2021)]|uniref:Thiamine ABC transporter substrate binding subunit n=1 Tax=Gymnodinialimonas phycosphaerae TaxID=2841589 RepID=A0A975YF81_9RHOB|nr:thiamine ABC transporter substrate binding subunit [Gymnodinialimonas phycosphaerae]MBY4894387.1 thiamine ABC transporter substrate binding subunit [Gymnodinialimonas phycosphaerae]